MNRKQKLFLATSMFIGLFICIPVVMGGIPVAFSAAAGNYDSAVLFPAGYKDYQLSFSGSGSVDVFVTSTVTDRDSYLATGLVPSTTTVVDNVTGSSGTLCLSYPNPEGTYYLIIGNKNGVVTVTGTYELDLGSCGIPGFEMVYIFLTLLTLFGFFLYKKKLQI